MFKKKVFVCGKPSIENSKRMLSLYILKILLTKFKYNIAIYRLNACKTSFKQSQLTFS